MVLKHALTPETFISLPRRSVIAPNSNGTLGLYSVSTHELGKGTTKEWRLMDLATGNSTQYTDEEKFHDVNWLPGSDNTIIALRSGEKGFTEILISSEVDAQGVGEQHRVAVIEAPLEALKLKALDDGSVALAVVCLADRHGNMYNDEDEKNQKLSSARIYDDINVREVCLALTGLSFCHRSAVR
jgi:hypothetical protein